MIKGPVNVLFMLTDRGFEFKELNTGSALFHDMFLGKPVSKERILLEILLEKPLCNLKERERELNTAMANKLKIKTASQKLELRGAQDVLEALTKYKNSEMELDELEICMWSILRSLYDTKSCASAYEAFLNESQVTNSSLYQQAKQFLTYKPKPVLTTKDIINEILQHIQSVNPNSALEQVKGAALSSR